MWQIANEALRNKNNIGYNIINQMIHIEYTFLIVKILQKFSNQEYMANSIRSKLLFFARIALIL